VVEDRWVAVAAWTDDELARLMEITDGDPGAYAASRSRIAVAEALQAAGIEAVPVEDFGDVHADPQVEHRGHFVSLTHPFMGEGAYERNGFRLSDAPGGYTRSGPTLGQDQDWVLDELLALGEDEREVLADEGAFD
jgi:benzylsuccinate CoA-transferase BbsF subunit